MKGCQEKCPICLDGLDENNTLELHCGHSLHPECWEELCTRRIQTLHTEFVKILKDCCYGGETLFLSHQRMSLELLRGGLLRCPLCRTNCSQKGHTTRGYIYRAPLIEKNTNLEKLPKIQVFWDLDEEILENISQKRFYHPRVRNAQVKEFLQLVPEVLKEVPAETIISGLIIPRKDCCGYFHAVLNENGK